MQPLPLAVLEHITTRDRHHDMLVLDPAIEPTASHGMWAARVALPPRLWGRVSRLEIIPLPHHREHYLTYQGPISGRGRVVRVDAGTALPHLWTPRRIVLTMRTCGFSGRLDLRKQSDRCWLGRIGHLADESLARCDRNG